MKFDSVPFEEMSEEILMQLISLVEDKDRQLVLQNKQKETKKRKNFLTDNKTIIKREGK